jgi:SAM-dependent methyltransferase
MHTSSHEKMAAFVSTYLTEFRNEPLTILDVGSQVVADQPLSYKPLFDAPAWTYTGLDVEAGLNVDVVPAHDYQWDELAADTFDVVVSGQAFEHIPFFWATAFEIGRVLRPGGVAVITAPGRGPQHRYPVDCWRFHDDGFQAVADYLGFEVLDVFTEWGRNMWDESILVMRKPVWSSAERNRFATRLWHQRALSAGFSELEGGLGSGPLTDPNTGPNSGPILDEGEPPTPSKLRDLVGGGFTEYLEELRVRGIEAQRIRREAAKPLHVRLIHKGVLRRLVNFLEPPAPFVRHEDLD